MRVPKEAKMITFQN